MRRFVSFALALAVALGLSTTMSPSRVSAAIPAPNFPNGDWSFAASGAWVGAGDDGWAVNIDASLSAFIFTGSLNGKLMGFGDDLMGGAQLEVTAWFFATMGGGVGYLAGDRSGPIYNFFLGAPIPTIPDKGLVLEPYYRPSYFDGEWLHEVGLMVRYTTWDG